MQSDLVKELGLDKLSADKQEEIVIKMTEVILKRMFVETMDKLNTKDQEALGDMMEMQTSPEEIDEFLKEKISNYDEILQGIVTKLVEEMKSIQA